jgi:hypothetical protein
VTSPAKLKSAVIMPPQLHHGLGHDLIMCMIRSTLAKSRSRKMVSIEMALVERAMLNSPVECVAYNLAFISIQRSFVVAFLHNLPPRLRRFA